ncbi:hypothetical protein A4X13_0g6032 [Tilletia indica]|uniref:Uncharacterized protein n=1 Tax=Tilletia indica TaxID=43049 RepID=A0A177TFF2_9BASI|nr:hypothetical protein A4X13_0g6032 [Tilletia indica]
MVLLFPDFSANSLASDRVSIAATILSAISLGAVLDQVFASILGDRKHGPREETLSVAPDAGPGYHRSFLGRSVAGRLVVASVTVSRLLALVVFALYLVLFQGSWSIQQHCREYVQAIIALCAVVSSLSFGALTLRLRQTIATNPVGTSGLAENSVSSTEKAQSSMARPRVALPLLLCVLILVHLASGLGVTVSWSITVQDNTQSCTLSKNMTLSAYSITAIIFLLVFSACFKMVRPFGDARPQMFVQAPPRVQSRDISQPGSTLISSSRSWIQSASESGAVNGRRWPGLPHQQMGHSKSLTTDGPARHHQHMIVDVEQAKVFSKAWANLIVMLVAFIALLVVSAIAGTGALFLVLLPITIAICVSASATLTCLLYKAGSLSVASKGMPGQNLGPTELYPHHPSTSTTVVGHQQFPAGVFRTDDDHQDQPTQDSATDSASSGSATGHEHNGAVGSAALAKSFLAAPIPGESLQPYVRRSTPRLSRSPVIPTSSADEPNEELQQGESIHPAEKPQGPTFGTGVTRPQNPHTSSNNLDLSMRGKPKLSPIVQQANETELTEGSHTDSDHDVSGRAAAEHREGLGSVSPGFSGRSPSLGQAMQSDHVEADQYKTGSSSSLCPEDARSGYESIATPDIDASPISAKEVQATPRSEKLSGTPSGRLAALLGSSKSLLPTHNSADTFGRVDVATNASPMSLISLPEAVQSAPLSGRAGLIQQAEEHMSTFTPQMPFVPSATGSPLQRDALAQLRRLLPQGETPQVGPSKGSSQEDLAVGESPSNADDSIKVRTDSRAKTNIVLAAIGAALTSSLPMDGSKQGSSGPSQNSISEIPTAADDASPEAPGTHQTSQMNRSLFYEALRSDIVLAAIGAAVTNTNFSNDQQAIDEQISPDDAGKDEQGQTHGRARSSSTGGDSSPFRPSRPSPKISKSGTPIDLRRAVGINSIRTPKSEPLVTSSGPVSALSQSGSQHSDTLDAEEVGDMSPMLGLPPARAKANHGVIASSQKIGFNGIAGANGLNSLTGAQLSRISSISPLSLTGVEAATSAHVSPEAGKDVATSDATPTSPRYLRRHSSRSIASLSVIPQPPSPLIPLPSSPREAQEPL